MRRVASLFSSKRSDRSDPAPSVVVSEASQPSSSNSSSERVTRRKSRLFNAASHLNVSTTPLATPQLSAGEQTNSTSSASSSGSASLRTPDDEGVRITGKKHWISWLPGKKSGTVRGHEASHPPEWEGIREVWSRPTPDLQPPPLGNQIQAVNDDSDDEMSSESDGDDSEAAVHQPARDTVTPTTIAEARANLRISSTNSLVPRLSLPPLLNLPGNCVFPRSCNPSRFLQPSQTIQSVMHKRILLRRLDHETLTHAEALSIIPFASRQKPPVTKCPSPQLDRIDAVALGLDTMRIGSVSQGLKQWVARSCFEDRMAVWMPDDQIGVTCRGVSGTSFGVADLEFSETLEVLAGAVREPPEEFEPLPSTSQLSSSGQSHSAPYKALPSPLRMQHGPPTLPVPPPTSISIDVDPQPTSEEPITVPTTVRRGVRFAEDDKEDQIPLGYVLRIKKNREEKAKFLREEQARRKAQEQTKAAKERNKLEAERRQLEKERKALETQKKAIEEEKRQRLYAEEVAAARLRRETQRIGMGPATSSSTSRDPDRLKVREAVVSTSTHSRPVYDLSEPPRRQASDPTGGSPAHTPSPTRSRPPSIVGGGVSPAANGSSRGSVAASSRPTSIHNSSSEDVRLRENRGGSSRRASVVSESSHTVRPSPDRRASSYSTWSIANMPPVPPMPMFAMEMPLLPPTPPFMMQQYGYRSRQSSYNSGYQTGPPMPPSPSRQTSYSLSTSHSMDRVNEAPHGRYSSNSSSRPDHQRRSSGDGIPETHNHSNKRNPPLDRDRRSTSHPTLPSPARALPPQLQVPPLPSPWTAPPDAPLHSPRGRPPASNRRQSVVS